MHDPNSSTNPEHARSNNPSLWNRRTWLATNATALVASAIPARRAQAMRRSTGIEELSAACAADHCAPADPGPMATLAQRAVDAAKRAGAQYADARVSRTVVQQYHFNTLGGLSHDNQNQGLSVRALVDGRWGFAASPVWTPDEASRLGKAAVALARSTARGSRRTVDLSQCPVVTGSWATPITINPFTVPVEEKADAIVYWKNWAVEKGVTIDDQHAYLVFARQERTVANSEGTLVHQTTFESGGDISVYRFTVGPLGTPERVDIQLKNLEMSAQGWEHILAARITDQLDTAPERIADRQRLLSGAKPFQVGEFTLVCDGATMAALTNATLGVATQLDRAMGYEANASGTSYLNDPLGMLGTATVAAPIVTVTANRSASQQLGTVKWDDEGVVPEPFTLVKDGMLVDYQTTREQAHWLAPYYDKSGIPARSRGCAASEDALKIPLQHAPNFALEASAQPGAESATLDALIGSVPEGVFVERGEVHTDYQARTGIILGEMRRIRQGRLGPLMVGGAVNFRSSDDLWKKVSSVGAPSTAMTVSTSQYQSGFGLSGNWIGKGQPAQMTSHSTQAVAAVIVKQPVIDPRKRA